MSNDGGPQIVGRANVGCATMLSPVHTLFFTFHNFEKLPHEPGNETRTPYLPCHGYLWKLRMKPGGIEQPGTETIYTSLCLYCKHPKNKNFEVETNASFRLGNSINKSMKTHVFKSDRKGFGCSICKRNNILEQFLNDRGLDIEVDIEIYTKKETIWTPSKRNIASRLLEMSCTGKDTDVTFLVGDEKFTTHRNILSIGAPDLRELVDDAPINCEITIDTFDASTFRGFLHFLYTDDLPPEEDFKCNARSFLKIANQFGCAHLKLHAEASLVKHDINEKNVLEMVSFADAMCCPLLKEKATDYFTANSAKVMSTKEWKELKESNLAVFAFLLESMCSSEHKISSGDDAEQNYNSECISGLRRKLEEKGLDVDGSREMLVKRLKTNSRK